MKKIIILLLVFVAALTSCKKTPEVNLKYVDIERDLVTVGSTTANIQCDYDYITTLKKAFIYYGVGEDEENMTSAEMRVVQASLYVELTGLRENTTYGYYYEFVNGFNSMRSEVKTFKTESMPVPPPEITLPTVITSAVTDITTNSATCGGEITSDGGAEVTERGICWSTNESPTLSDAHIAIDSALNVFTAIMTGLEENTTYHVRAYAINEKGTAYGLEKEFKTLSNGGGGNAPIGAINGLFTINTNGDKVYLSQGNLQYQASTDTWRFAEHQWDFVGGIHNDEGIEYGTVFENGEKCDNSRIASSYTGWIDLFGWGTSGFNHGAICYQPWSVSTNYSDYYAYGINNGNIFDQNGLADWGSNAIINGGNEVKLWRTLTINEWNHIITSRHTASGIRYAKGQVNDVNGLLLLPDDWDANVYHLNNTNTDAASFNSNIIDSAQWEVLEKAGAVFLPFAYWREGIIYMGIWSSYWSSSYFDDLNAAHCIGFADVFVTPIGGMPQYNGCSVRLAQDASPQPSIQIPSVTTSDVTGITSTAATLGGSVTNNGGSTIVNGGVCWSTTPNPTMYDNNMTYDGEFQFGVYIVNDLEPNTTYHVRAFATNAAGTGYGEDKVFTTLSGGGNGNHDYVDLGLPSGTLWATCNVGANSPEEYGDYYAWGEVLTKQFYGWITYQHCYNGDFQQLTKYCTNPSYGYQGFTDNLTVLQQEDDVASVAWGGDWCIPSRAQWQELLENTTNIKVTQNGVVGRRFTACNGNSLFLPAAGEFNNGTVVDCGWYLSNTLSLTYNYNNSAWGLYFSLAWDSNHCYMASNMTRCFGHSIRPVRVSSNPPVLPVELPDVGIINIIDITSTSVSCESVVVDDGGAVVTDRGLCCSTSLNPTLNDIHVSTGSGAGYFTTIVNGLTPNTNYYVCAYATNEVGTSYSVAIPFTTLQLK